MTTPTMRPVGMSAEASHLLSKPQPLTCRRCKGELVPSFLPRFLRHVEKPEQSHYPIPFLSPSQSSPSVFPPAGGLLWSEDQLTGEGSAVALPRRAQPVHS